MKKYKQILEAINRGIQLALDDFDDEELVQNIKSKQVQNRDYTKEYLDLLRDEVVDLGLPSRTLWCKYNLGVDQNQLYKAVDWYGDYYAWGELEPNKAKPYWDNYKFGNYNKLTKYCNNSKFGLNGFDDNLTQLLPEDDAAYQNKKFLNFKFHIPTKEQCEELLKYTKNYLVKNYDPNKLVHNLEDDGGIQGLNGAVFEGKNGNQLFIPISGNRRATLSSGVYYYCYLWTSSINLHFTYNACCLYIGLSDIEVNSSARYFDHTIRPVINL